VSGIVSILTDFGTADGYVAAIKGVVLGINREARIVDLTHEVRPQDVWGGAFVLGTAHMYFPRGTIHLAVVDPGVGTDRAGVILDTREALFVAPDNGLLSFVLEEAPGMETRQHEDSTHHSSLLTRHSLPAGWRAARIAEPRFWLPEPSNTFHGRDMFAPVAAHLSLGEPLDSFGPAIDSLLAFSRRQPERLPDGRVRGAVLHIDRFGNVITNLRRPDLPLQPFEVRVGARVALRLAQTYADGRGLVALMGSSGYLEIALPGGSASAELGVGVGEVVWALPSERRTI
jgi:S-adenosyl-L-methionine hydrolase (adenosine-forming)